MPPGAKRFINNELSQIQGQQQGVNFGVQEVAEVVADMLGPNIGARGPKGPRGPQGKQGVQGRTGSKGDKGDTPSVEDLVKELSKTENAINPKAIKGLDEAVRRAIPRSGSPMMMTGSSASTLRILDTGVISKEGASEINFIGATVVATENGVDITTAGGTDTNLGTTNLTSTGTRTFDMAGNTLDFFNNAGFSITNGGNNHQFTANKHSITSAAANTGGWIGFNDGTDNVTVFSGAGTPEGTIAADQGSFYFDSSGAAPWYKTTDTVNTGWTQLGAGGGNTIYSADDTLAGDRNVTLGGNDLTFTGGTGSIKIQSADGQLFSSAAGIWYSSNTISTFLSHSTTGLSLQTAAAPGSDYFTISPKDFVTNGTSFKLYEATAFGTNSVGFKAPNSISADVMWILPNADGTNGQLLSTNGSGTLSWSTVSATPNLDDAYNNFGAAAPTITLDQAEGQTAGLSFLSSTAVDAITIQKTAGAGSTLKLENSYAATDTVLEVLGSNAGFAGTLLDLTTNAGGTTVTGINLAMDSASLTSTILSVSRDDAATGAIAVITEPSNTYGIYASDGSPEGTVAADIGSFCLDYSGGAPYYKTTDTVNTGWTQLGAGGGGNTIYSADDSLAGARTVTIPTAGLNGGLLFDITSNSAFTGVKINRDTGSGDALEVTTSSASTALQVTQTGSSGAVKVDANTTTGNAFEVNADSLTTGRAFLVSSQTTGGSASMAEFNTSTTSSQVTLSVIQQGTNKEALTVSATNNTTAPHIVLNNSTSDAVEISTRAISPETLYAAGSGSLHLDSTAGAGRAYIKTTDTGATGWTQLLQLVGNGTVAAYDDDTAAGVGGLTAGDIYQTTGSGAAPLNAAGILMIKQ